MNKYYTRACNFYYGVNAKRLIKKKLALPLCGNINIAFDKLEIFTRKKTESHQSLYILKILIRLALFAKKKFKWI